MKDKYIRFAHEYIIHDNAAKAARAVGCPHKYSDRHGYAILRRKGVRAYIDELLEEQKQRTEITADKVLEQYRRLAFADIEDYYHYIYELRFIPSMSDKERSKQIRMQKYIGYKIDIKVYDALCKSQQFFYVMVKELKDFSMLTIEQRAAIQSLTYDKNGNPILKLSSKETSLDALSKHLGIYDKDNKQKANKININNRSLNDFYNKPVEVEEGDELKMNLH